MNAVSLAGVFMLAALMSRAAPAAGPPPASAATAAPLATPFRWTLTFESCGRHQPMAKTGFR